MYCGPFARWRHFCTTLYDQNLSGLCFLAQIGDFVIQTSLGLQKLNMKEKSKTILVVLVKWRHCTSGLVLSRFWGGKSLILMICMVTLGSEERETGEWTMKININNNDSVINTELQTQVTRYIYKITKRNIYNTSTQRVSARISNWETRSPMLFLVASKLTLLFFSSSSFKCFKWMTRPRAWKWPWN